MTDSPCDNQKSSFKQKLGKKEIKIYLLCGIVATFVLAESFMGIVGGLFGVLLNIPLDILNNLIFGVALGKGGTELLSLYTMFIGVAISFLLILFIVKPWRPYLKALGTAPSGNRVSMLLLGLLIGFAMNAVCIAIAALTGSIQIEFVQFSIVGFLVFLVFIFIQASTEEIVCRGFAYQRIKRTYNATVAIIATSALFSLGHIFNPGITPLALLDIFLTGVLYALMVHYCDSIWLPMGAHTAWNFTQNVLFGLPNSGLTSTYSFFGLAGDAANGIAYDTVFGVEGTIVAVAVNALAIVALYIWGRNHKKQEYDIWQGSALEASQAATAAAAVPAPVTDAAMPVAQGTVVAAPNEATAANATNSAPSIAPNIPAPKKRWFY